MTIKNVCGNEINSKSYEETFAKERENVPVSPAEKTNAVIQRYWDNHHHTPLDEISAEETVDLVAELLVAMYGMEETITDLEVKRIIEIADTVILMSQHRPLPEVSRECPLIPSSQRLDEEKRTP